MTDQKMGQLLEMLGLSEEPLGVMYVDGQPSEGLTPQSGQGHSCVINYLRQARTKKQPVWFAADRPGCPGGWVYLGFISSASETVNIISHHVTTGLPGQEGERYLPEPSSLHRMLAALDMQPAAAPYCLVKPLSMFSAHETPSLITFFCRAEALTGLCQLAYFAFDDHEAVAMPFGAGCTNIFAWPLRYQRQGIKKAVIGGADPSCRPLRTSSPMVRNWRGSKKMRRPLSHFPAATFG